LRPEISGIVCPAHPGVSYRTFQSWTRQGRADEKAGVDTLKSAFLRDLRQAEAEGIAARMALIMKAGKKDWRAAQAINVSRYPEHFDANRSELRLLRKEVTELRSLLSQAKASAHIEDPSCPSLAKPGG
jgi:hypothetical protein